jgi:hypothetical protein
MRACGHLACLLLLLAAAPALAQDPAPEALGPAAAKLGVTFAPVPGVAGAYAASLTSGLTTCDRIDLEVLARDGGSFEVRAYPRIKGERIDPRTVADREALAGKLAASSGRIAPLAWVAEGNTAIHAACTADAAALEGALMAVASIDKEMADLLPALKPALTDEQVTAKLKEAAAADEAGRAKILASIAPYLPELTPSVTPGRSAFVKVTMNGRGAAFDAFRFRVAAKEGDQRLVWAFAYPPGTAKGWYIAPVDGDAPKFVKFHKGSAYKDTGVPQENATLLQRSETPLRPGGEYVIWFGFKVTTPVDLYVDLGCFPFVKSDRDAPGEIEKALGLKR